MEHLNLFVSIISVISAIASLTFYIAARQIQTDINFRMKEFAIYVDNRFKELTISVDNRFERSQIILSSQFQRVTDRNSSRITNLEARVEYIESAFEDPDYCQLVCALDQESPEENTDFLS
ncbi:MULTISPECIES: hypothetical protein [unclassified Microcoleus]|uniref:hypothetical protein n=1 Tax=unclassified Microcoleus TaxID=2642155 RepID=UPI002FD1E3FB